MTMSTGDSNKVIKQIGNFCLLFSILNALPDTQSRRRFLLSEDLDDDDINEEALKNFKKVLHRHNHFRRRPFSTAFNRGVNGVHIVYYLRHLEEIGVIRSFVYNKLGDNNAQRRGILKKIIDGERQNHGKVFLLTGFSTTNKDWLAKIKRRVRKRPLEGEQEVHILNLMLQCDLVRKNNEHQSCHAVCLKVDREGNCWLHDPGKITVKKISFEPKEFDRLIDSLFDIYLLHKFEIEFN